MVKCIWYFIRYDLWHKAGKKGASGYIRIHFGNKQVMELFIELHFQLNRSRFWEGYRGL